jgi:UDP-N-acetylmuramoyl-tripeptide--D-alanyl-D-alanine ligase
MPSIEINKLYELFQKSDGVSIDSRTTRPNQIFFGLGGVNVDGSKFAMDAIQKGAMCAVIRSEFKVEHPQIFAVDDVLIVLQKLATYHRQTLGVPVFGLTGSNGKTSSKELIAAVLSKKFRVHFTQGNFNNHIGVPLTLLGLTTSHEMAVIEMGANHQGEIDTLSRIAQPDFGYITNIGKAHLEGFGGIEGVKKGKSELFRYLKSVGGTIFYNVSNQIIPSLIPPDSITFGFDAAAWIIEETLPYLKVRMGEEVIQTQLYGAYNIENIAAAWAVGEYFQVPEKDRSDAIENYAPNNKRSQIIQRGTNTIILDAYNSNPTSLGASLQSFIADYTNRDAIVLLGDMLELGVDSKDEHRQILNILATCQWKRVILIGAEFISCKEGFNEFEFFHTAAEAKAVFSIDDYENTNFFLKGSRGIAVDQLLG